MNQKKISASMMCSDLAHLKDTLKIFEDNQVDYLHIDVMDGVFVPNLGLGVDYIRCLRDITNTPLDLHLMIREPEYKLSWFGIQKNDIVSLHYESTEQIQRAIDLLKKYDCKCFVAINPGTPIYSIEEVIEDIDGINLLMVNPGFAGQKMVPSTMRKMEKLVDYLKELDKQNIEIEVDGNITLKKAEILSGYGAQIFVAGTSCLFNGHLECFDENIRNLRNCINII
ncbi:MAG: ribulose-phosphate 3-epimerase [Aeriscardovia sp.]|nr:ribulose-phosphate 3-epimerase [Aeriscardovia sp.]MBR2755764.1 ribulose-phosphate 3-epimerase [Lachnospiraceae bacterium]